MERPAPVQQLYAPTARVTWNGNPIAYGDLPAFVQQMPKSAHEVQAFDCHPISGERALQRFPDSRVELTRPLPRSSGSANGASPPSLVVTVSGQVRTPSTHIAMYHAY